MDNLDISSSGENITLEVNYDYDLMQIYYDDFIEGCDGNKVYKIEGRRNTIAFLIGDYEKPFYKLSELKFMKKAALFELWQGYDFGYNDDYTKSEYISDLLSITIACHYDYAFKKLQSRYLDEDIQHKHFISRGYSQGDAVYIVDVGADYDVLANRKSIDHILWNTPIRIYLSINDNDELGYDLLENNYEYDSQKVIENLNKLNISDYAKNWISANIPQEPNYLF